MRILGLDVGERRIGAAVGDAEERLALPLTVLHCRGDAGDFQAVVDLAQRQGAEAIVVGMPVSLDGTLGPQAQRVRGFIDGLSRHTDLPILPWDERLSTVQAERLLLTSGVRRQARRAQRDALAAAIILQSYLDSHRRPADALTEDPGPCVSCP